MSDARILPVQETTGTVTFTILVDGQEAPNTLEVDSLVCHKDANKIPYARITLRDGNSAEENFEISNQALFVPGNELELQLGYDSQNTTVFKGIIVKQSIRLTESGSALYVECRDEAVKTTIGRKSAYFEEQTDSEVIEEILGNYSFANNVESTELSHQELVQYYCSDWDFIVSRAEANGMLVLVSDGEFQVKKPEMTESKFSLIYGSTLYEFEAEIDARYQQSTVKSSAWDYSSQEVLESEGAAPVANELGNISESKLAEVVGLEDYSLKHSGKVIDQELQAWADAKLVKNHLAKIIGRAKTEGIADVFPGDVVEFQGVGDRYSGNAYITAVRHEMVESSWYTHLQFGRSPEWFYSESATTDKPASGLIPGINGLQIGIVKTLEGDPDGEDRIQVMLPLIDPEANGVWARLASLDAGENRGYVFRPEIEDEVIVGFINDDPRDAVVLGMLHSSAKPAPVPPADDNHEKGLVSRSEMRFWLDDDKKIMTLDTPAGNKIEINEDSTSITIEDQNGNTVVLNDSGIEMDSPSDIKISAGGNVEIKASGDCTIEGTNVEAKASGEFKADGAAGAKLTTSAIAEISGSLIQIN